MIAKNSKVPVLNTDGSPAMPVERKLALAWLKEGKAIVRKNNWGVDYLYLLSTPSNSPSKAFLALATDLAPALPEGAILSSGIRSPQRRDITLNSRRSKRRRELSQKIKISSIVSSALGGMVLASNTTMSGYGFIFLALSSSQLLFASIMERNQVMIFYASILFFFVDLLGVYRWVIA